MKNKKIAVGLIIGGAAGVIDSLIMISRQGPAWEALSAFTFWVVAGLVIAIAETGFKGFIKGIVMSLILLIPVGIPIAWKNPSSLLPMILFTAFVGGVIGYLIGRFQ